ncbi:MAG: hypothetical protein JXR51_02465, partial [Bacteroidales bacterium]|nr:hypothetical protein [Bacteroidales bacterium]MBN2756011.1 hypothetical protein [Bacteroidales bacterium]
MKKIFLLVVFSLSLAALSTAQFGVKAGMNFAKMSGAEIDGLDQVSLNNFHAGVFMEKDIIPLINIRF